MSLDILKERIKNKQFNGLFYICGGEEYLKDYYYQILRKKSVTEMEEFNVTELPGDGLSLNSLENLINSFPMMSENKFISVIDLEHKLLKDDYKDELLRILKEIPDYCCVVFIDTARKEGKDDVLKRLIEKAGGLVVKIDAPGTAQLAAWGKRHFAGFGKKISNEDMHYILRIAENDMLSLKNEISKIASYSRSETVTRTEINAVITKSLETNRYALSEALSKRDFRTVVHVVDDLYAQNYDDIVIANLIYYCIVDLLRANFALSAGKRNTDLHNDFGTNEYGASKMMRATKAMTERQLKECADLCYICEKRLKGEAGDKREMVYQLIAGLMNCGVRK